jgi:DNA-directed RNA polymerase omega subunit|tara:strand:- start:540 stop:890 length:351 start_codon:yes stop_codon:yes gene_type:complete
MSEIDDKQIEAYGYHQAAHDIVNSQHLLVLMASKRAREIQQGSAPLVEYQKGQKTTTIAIKEIALGFYTEEHYNGKIKSAEDELMAKRFQEEEQKYERDEDRADANEHPQSNTLTK